MAAAKEFPDSTSADTRTGKSAVVDQIEHHIKHFRSVVKVVV